MKGRNDSLSDCIDEVLGMLLPQQGQGLELSPEGVEAALEVLADWAMRAQQLEDVLDGVIDDTPNVHRLWGGRP